MLAFPGISAIAQIYESANSFVYRGIRDRDGQATILKVLKENYPTPAELDRYRTEYNITKSLKLPGVVQVYDLQKYQNTLVMFLEDFGGESVKIWMQQRQFSLKEFLEIAIATTESLGQIHAANIIHKDINPSNIVVNPTTQQVKIIDLGIATQLTRETPTLKNPNILEGTLAYISPEQTGRMNRTLDYRTDFYSLGVTFYEMLTHQLPFDSADLLELVHCHIAKQPLPPALINPKIPQVVSDIIMKLMAKTAEERYQSAWGIKADLEECLAQLTSQQNISEFPLGRYDISDRFKIPQKLYGRDEEIAALLTAFDRASSIQSELMLVAGYSGIGKSVLVQELYKPITQKRGYFIAGKFDQYQRNIPYSAVVTAFQELVRQLLTETEEQLKQWREKLLAALGVNAQVIIEVIPEVELIIGRQAPVPELGATEALNRFNLAFQNLIKVFTQPEHPLALFIDDLQWADVASLKLIQLLMSGAAPGLFLIGAYRDNEVTGGHPLMLTLEEIKKSGATVNSIFLSPLELPIINQLISETVKQLPEKTMLLAELVQGKTGGNPFFLREFLKSLYGEELLNFNYQLGAWQWNLQEIQGRGITDNLVDLMANKIQKMPSATQEVLKLAACIGNRFNLEILAIVHQCSETQTALDLREAIAQGLLLPLADNYQIVEFDLPRNTQEKLTIEYKFIHDRIQQAAYSLLSESQQQATHWQIGQLLLQHSSESIREDKIFDLVNQLNLGLTLIDRPDQRYEIANFNSIAAKKAIASAAYDSALAYLKIAMELLAADGWQQRYELTVEIYQQAVKAAYLCGKLPEMERWIQQVQQHGKNLLDRVKVDRVQILAYKGQNKSQAAIDYAIDTLKRLGENIPKKPQKYQVFLGLLETKLALAGKRISDLADLPTMTNPVKKAAMQVISNVSAAAYTTSPQTMVLLICKQVNLSIKYGNTSDSAFAYGTYGLIQCAILGNIELGAQFGKLALKMIDRLNAKESQTKTLYIISCFITHWTQPARLASQSLLDNYQSGLDTGDLQFTAYSAYMYAYYSYFEGKELSALGREIAGLIESPVLLKQPISGYNCQLCQQVALNLIGESDHTYQLIGSAFDEGLMVPMYRQTNYISGLAYFYIHKLILCYLFEEYEAALENAAIAKPYLASAIGMIFVPVFYFYDSLIQLALYSAPVPIAFSRGVTEAQKNQQKSILKAVAANQKKLKKWADSGPMNYRHKFYLVEAERYRVLGQEYQAMKCYDRAIAIAQENEYIQEVALAYELAAKFYLSIGQEITGKAYIQEASYAYQLWGATAKVNDLQHRYGKFFPTPLRRPSFEGGVGGVNDLKSSTMATTSGSTNHLDIATIMKASQAISGEIVLDKLLASLMKITIENAGAQRGYLILSRQGNLMVEAAGSIDQQIVTVLQPIPVGECEQMAQAIVNYVARTQETVVLNNATKAGNFTNDPYIKKYQPLSILCVPLINQNKLISIVYLENNLTSGAFTPERVEILQLLSGQVAIAIENAKLYAEVRENESRLAQFLDAMPVGVGILDAAGNPCYTNRVARELLGQGVVSDASSEQIAEVYRLYKAGTGKEYPSGELPIVRAFKGEASTADDIEIYQSDRIIPVESFAKPVYDEQGKIVYAITSFQDITERKKAEADRERFTNELFQLNQAYERFVPRQFLHFLEKDSIVNVELGDQVQLEMSVLFSDIRDFTTISESLTPQENFRFINSYLSRMEPAIIENNGFIDKYIGDAIMALFGGEADNAVKAAISMLHRLTEYNQHRANCNYIAIRNGIGINTGLLMLGTVGGKSRMDSTVISDAVNLASRVESLTKNYGLSLLITEDTYTRLKHRESYHIRKIDRVQVKGKSQLVTVYEVFDADMPEVKEGKFATLATFSEALFLYNEQQFYAAAQLFDECWRQNPGDRVAQIYFERCQKML